MKIIRGLFPAILGIFFASAIAANAADTPQIVTIHARRYAFVPSEITVQKGRPVRLVLTSDDVDHGLSIQNLGLHLDVPKNKTVETTFTPEQAGDFAGRCSRFCGSGHGMMKFVIHVVQ